ncbi:MAG: DegV family protein [Lachnospiraceae bacterium]|nr:DegV family protein [Ruminococcus sp.]MCM1274990.1 DegV family protein [Lachnospiraceae bacterium]
MSKVKICADSVCDLSEELKKRYDISVVPLYVNKGGETFKDGAEIGQKEVFEHYRTTGKLCTTSAVNVEDFANFFKEQLVGYDELIIITISSEFSACFQNANIAADDFPNVRVVDSRNLSTGEGLVAVSAAKLAAKGLSADEIVGELENVIPRVDATFFVANVEYLHKGGRCSSIAALGANLLKLKPCIAVLDGKMKVIKKYRGSIAKTIGDYVKDRLDGAAVDDDLIFITHTTSAENTALAAEEIKKYQSFKEIAATDAGCTVACHCGEDTLGVLFIRK